MKSESLRCGMQDCYHLDSHDSTCTLCNIAIDKEGKCVCYRCSNTSKVKTEKKRLCEGYEGS